MPEDQRMHLLGDPVALDLLESTVPARLAYCWSDGTPRVVPIAFHWDGSVFTLGTPPRAPKVAALRADPHVALTIDSNTFPYKVLQVRGEAALTEHDDVVPEYEAAVLRYLGPEAGGAWLSQLRGRPMVKITVTPQQVRILDFVERFPSALSA